MVLTQVLKAKPSDDDPPAPSKQHELHSSCEPEVEPTTLTMARFGCSIGLAKAMARLMF